MTNPPGRSVPLERSALYRVFGGPLFQPLWVLFFGAAIVALASGARQPGVVAGLAGVAVVLWLPGALARAGFDDAGIHRRVYLAHDYAWPDIRAVELQFQSLGVLSGRQLIRITLQSGRRVALIPAEGRSRATREFADALLAEAQARGIATDTSGWPVSPPRRAPWEE